MKLKLLAFALILAACSGTGFAQSPYAGIYGFGIEIDGTGTGATNSGQLTLYAVQNNSDLAISGPTLDSSDWTSASPGSSPTFSLGTFTQGSGATLTLAGGSMDTFKGNGGDVDAANLFYSIGAVSTSNLNGADAGSYTQINSPGGFNFGTNLSSGSGNQLWDYQSASVNLLAGLSPGTYEISVYGNELDNTGGGGFESGAAYANNGGGGANYGATFTIAPAATPEPSTWAMMLGGVGLLVCIQRLRRKSSV